MDLCKRTYKEAYCQRNRARKSVQKVAEKPLSAAHRQSPVTNPLSNKEIVKQAPKLDLKSDQVAIRELKAACQTRNEEKLGQLIKEMAPFRADYSRTIKLMMDHGALEELKFFFGSSAGFEEFREFSARPTEFREFFKHSIDRFSSAQLIVEAAARAFQDNRIMFRMIIQSLLQSAVDTNDLALANVACKLGANPKVSDSATRTLSPEMRHLLEEAAKLKAKQ